MKKVLVWSMLIALMLVLASGAMQTRRSESDPGTTAGELSPNDTYPMSLHVQGLWDRRPEQPFQAAWSGREDKS